MKIIDGKAISAKTKEELRLEVSELKETSGNRDFTQGGTTSGVTAASAILALQESGSKLSRDMVKASFRAYSEICYLIVELIRQFYTEPRSFRITGEKSKTDFVTFSSNQFSAKEEINLLGSELLARRPIFDIKIVPQKQNPYQKARQNELAKELFSLGMLSKERRDEARLAIKMMDFEGKEELLSKLSD